MAHADGSSLFSSSFTFLAMFSFPQNVIKESNIALAARKEHLRSVFQFCIVRVQHYSHHAPLSFSRAAKASALDLRPMPVWYNSCPAVPGPNAFLRYDSEELSFQK